MFRWLGTLLRGWETRLFRIRIRRALSLQLRGEARNDGLVLRGMRTGLRLEWEAREIHPWDRARRGEERDALFVKQTLQDTEAAVARVFAAFPQVDAVEVRVFEPNSREVILSGDVSRAKLGSARPLSDRMWLGELGIEFRLAGNRFERMAAAAEERQAS